MRALVTGGNGFVGRHLIAELRRREYDVTSAGHGTLDSDEIAFDLDDLDGIRSMVATARPEVVFHLAAQASVADAVRAPLDAYRANFRGTAFLLEALRALPDPPRLLFVSSAEVYGVHARDEMPLRETTLPSPATIYAASKLAAESIVLASARTYGLRALVVRPFNLIGPGQSERFVVGAFSHRLAKIAAGGPAYFPVGNLTAQRDFLDVRDGVRGFADLAERGADGEIYNVCGGKPTSVAEILRQLVFAARVGVEIREDPELMRPVDVPIAYGDNAKLCERTGWAPTYALVRTLRDAYASALLARGVVPEVSTNGGAHGI